MNEPKHAERFLGIGLSRQDSARYVGVSPTTFDGLVEEGLMPAPRRIRKRKIWDRRELEAAFDELPRDGASDDDDNPWDQDAA